MRYFISAGISCNVVNSLTETPLHLLASSLKDGKLTLSYTCTVPSNSLTETPLHLLASSLKETESMYIHSVEYCMKPGVRLCTNSLNQGWEFAHLLSAHSSLLICSSLIHSFAHSLIRSFAHLLICSFHATVSDSLRLLKTNERQ